MIRLCVSVKIDVSLTSLAGGVFSSSLRLIPRVITSVSVFMNLMSYERLSALCETLVWLFLSLCSGLSLW